MNNAEDLAAFSNHQRRSAGARDLIHTLADVFRECATRLVHINPNRVGCAFSDETPGLTVTGEEIYSAHPSLGGKGHELSMRFGDLTSAQLELLLGEHD